MFTAREAMAALIAVAGPCNPVSINASFASSSPNRRVAESSSYKPRFSSPQAKPLTNWGAHRLFVDPFHAGAVEGVEA